MNNSGFQENSILYKGEAFPYRSIDIEENGLSFYINVSVLALSKKLFDDEKGYTDKEAEWIDNQIAYYVNTEQDLQRSDESILNEIYG